MQELLQITQGNNPILNMIGFVFFTLYGMLLIKTIRYNIKKKKLRNQEPPVVLKFSFSHWLNDNSLDFICAFFTSYAVYRFLPDTKTFLSAYFTTFPDFVDDMFLGFLLGVCFQFITHKLLNKIKIVPNGTNT